MENGPQFCWSGCTSCGQCRCEPESPHELRMRGYADEHAQYGECVSGHYPERTLSQLHQGGMRGSRAMDAKCLALWVLHYGQDLVTRALPLLVGMSRLRHPAATLMGGKHEGDARISAIVRNWNILLYLQQKHGGGEPTARLAVLHCPGSPTGHGYNQIAHTLLESTNQHNQPTFRQLFCKCETRMSP